MWWPIDEYIVEYSYIVIWFVLKVFEIEFIVVCGMVVPMLGGLQGFPKGSKRHGVVNVI